MVAGKHPATIFSFYTALTLPDSGCIDSDPAWFIDLIVAIYLMVTGLSGHTILTNKTKMAFISFPSLFHLLFSFLSNLSQYSSMAIKQNPIPFSEMGSKHVKPYSTLMGQRFCC
jgi:hypothetical protein